MRASQAKVDSTHCLNEAEVLLTYIVQIAFEKICLYRSTLSDYFFRSSQWLP